MKKLAVLIIILLLILCSFVAYEKSSYLKIFKIDTPDKLYIDLNKNLLFDEDKPFIVKNLHSVSDLQEDISQELRFLFEYFALEEAKKVTKNAFCKIDKNELIINGKKYRELLLDTDYFYDDSKKSKDKFKENLKKYNPDDYVIVNLKSNKYHKIDCEKAKEIKHYKVINKNQINDKYAQAKCCFSNNPTVNKQNIINNNNQNYKYSDGNISVYFINLNSVSKPDNHCKTEACSVLKNQIDSAKQTIDFAIYGFNNEPQLYNSLKRAKERGVKIRWIFNYDNSNNLYYPDLELLKELLPDYKNNLNNDAENKRKGLMHNKFFIFDKQKVYTGTANISATDLSGFNSNYTVLINSPEIADIYGQEFEQMYQGKFSNNKDKIIKSPLILEDGTKIEVLFSPKDIIINNYIIDLINNANKYIYAPAFFITDKNIKDALINAKLRNVDIKVITDATSAASKYSVHKDLRDLGISVKTENYAGKMHSKVLIIDDKYTVIGSMNFTSNGNKRNDENILIINNQNIAKYMKKTFIVIWNNIPDKYLKYDPKAESAESIGSCSDNIDNDYDNKTDSNDEGCLIKQYLE